MQLKGSRGKDLRVKKEERKKNMWISLRRRKKTVKQKEERNRHGIIHI